MQQVGQTRRPIVRTKILGLVVTAAGVFSAMLPAAASAAPVIRFAVTPGSSCVGGSAHPDTNLQLRWRNGGGYAKVVVTVRVSEFGQWSYCDPYAVLEAGDTLRANDSIGQRTFSMPELTLVVDRVQDQFRGRAPAGSQMELSFHAGIFADYYESAEVAANAEGRWLYELDYDLLAGIDAYLWWTSAQGDTVETQAQAAQVTVTIGRSRVFGAVREGPSAAIGLRDATNSLKGVASASGDDYGGFDSRFENGSNAPVTVAAGDRVIAKQMASDLDWIVPDIEGVADVPNDLVSGRCHDAGMYTDVIIVEVIRGGQRRGYAFADADSNGAFVADFGQPPDFFYAPANIRHGDKILVRCMLETGDWAQRFFAVP